MIKFGIFAIAVTATVAYTLARTVRKAVDFNEKKNPTPETPREILIVGHGVDPHSARALWMAMSCDEALRESAARGEVTWPLWKTGGLQ